MKVISGRIVSVEAERLEGKEFQGLDMNIQVHDIKDEGKNIEVVYSQATSYKKDFARMNVRGVIVAEVDDKEKKKILEDWKKNKQLPLDHAEGFLMAINYATSTVGTLLAFAINVNAPLNIPRTKIMAANSPQKAG
ncbi:MAG: hypothetical protein V1717_01130 [Candidatus Micrarchaeota archaeon]